MEDGKQGWGHSEMAHAAKARVPSSTGGHPEPRADRRTVIPAITVATESRKSNFQAPALCQALS